MRGIVCLAFLLVLGRIGFGLPVDDYWRAVVGIAEDQEAISKFFRSGELPGETSQPVVEAEAPLSSPSAATEPHTGSDAASFLPSSSTTPSSSWHPDASEEIKDDTPWMHGGRGLIHLIAEHIFTPQVLRSINPPMPLSLEQRQAILKEAEFYFSGQKLKAISHPFTGHTLPRGLMMAMSTSKHSLREFMPGYYVTMLDEEAATRAARLEGGMFPVRKEKYHLYVFKYVPTRLANLFVNQFVGLIEAGTVNYHAAMNLDAIHRGQKAVKVIGPDSFLTSY